MKLEYLHSEPENTRLILIFAGWSAGAETGRDILMEGWDVAVVHDFSEMSLDITFLDNYYTVYLFAWSLGVVAASRLLPAERITAAFALNGTERPVDDLLGIPTSIYEGTAAALDERHLLKFRMRMAGDRETFAAMRQGCDNQEDDVENLRNQLYAVKDSCANDAEGNRSALPWVRAYLSRNDRIFPFENMRRFWQSVEDVDLVELGAPHYVPMTEIVKAVIADTAKVSQRFAKANISYDTHAIAQYSAAIKLANLFFDCKPAVGGSVLEIGCGTGLFTHEYAPKLKPRSATFVDITKTGPFGVAPQEQYFMEDAERWMERQTEEWDAIVSASAIQWFADIPRFLHLCHKRLKPGGVLAISTFSPGNMEELDTLRPSPLLYPKAEMIRECLEKEFEDVRVIEDEIKVEFKSVREMLMHLKHTGVGGSAPGGNLSLKEMSHLRTLTYRPLYFTAKKR